jgi:hypothetical protein
MVVILLKYKSSVLGVVAPDPSYVFALYSFDFWFARRSVLSVSTPIGFSAVAVFLTRFFISIAGFCLLLGSVVVAP